MKLREIVLSGILALNACDNSQKEEIKKVIEKEYGLVVRECAYRMYEDLHIGSEQIVCYMGMPNENRFSLSDATRGAVNAYYPVAIKEINWNNHILEVKKVSPERIVLVYKR